jgi:3-phosphoshikimate 1-carboxyvinyltransferase
MGRASSSASFGDGTLALGRAVSHPLSPPPSRIERARSLAGADRPCDSSDVTDLLVHPQREPLAGRLPAPPDAVAAEIGLLLGALAKPGAETRLSGRGLPPLVLPAALRRLGLEVRESGDGVTVRAGPFTAPTEPLPCPHAATSLGLLVGILAAQPFSSVIDGEVGALGPALHATARALRSRGGDIEGRLDPASPGTLATPVTVAPAPLSELSYEVPRGAVAGKAAALGSGLFAEGTTFVHEVLVSDDRCERQLAARGADVTSAGPMLRLAPQTEPLDPVDGAVSGDPALAAVLIAAGLAVPNSLVGLRGVSVSPSRSGWLEALRDGGAAIALVPTEAALGEATADLHLRAEPIRGLRFAAERAHRAGVPLPVLAAMAALASGDSELFDLPLGRAGEIEDTLAMLHAFGVDADRSPSGIAIRGRSRPLRACALVAGDGAIAMAAAVLALSADGPCRIASADAIVVTFPRFVGCLRALGARIEVRP